MINKYMNYFIEKFSADMPNTKYCKWYLYICQRALSRSISGYTEKHHIFPKSIYPEFKNDKNNIVKLTAREHFICHWLLTKIVLKEKYKMFFALNMMFANKSTKRYIPQSSIIYKNIKEQISKNNIGSRGQKWYTNGNTNISVNSLNIIPEGFYPGRYFSSETRNKISIKAKEKILSKDTKEKMSIAKKNKPGRKQSEVSRAKISKARSGRKATDETKSKMSQTRTGMKRGPYNIKSRDFVEYEST